MRESHARCVRLGMSGIIFTFLRLVFAKKVCHVQKLLTSRTVIQVQDRNTEKVCLNVRKDCVYIHL